MKRRLAVGAGAALLALSTSGCMIDVHEYGAQQRAAVTWYTPDGMGHTGPAASDPSRNSAGYDTCVWILDQRIERYLAEAACHVNRSWVPGSFGYLDF